MKDKNKKKGAIQNLTKKIQKTGGQFNQFASKKQAQKDKKNSDRQQVLSKLQKLNKQNSFKDARSKKLIKNIRSKEKDLQQDPLGKNKHKVNKYELLSDDEEEGLMQLTHRGKNLERLDDFKDEINDFSDDPDDVEHKSFVDKMHFQGFSEKEKTLAGQINPSDTTVKKTKKEIYEEIIKKSKQGRYLQQKQKDEDMEKLQELDDNFDEMIELFQYRSTADKFKDQEKDKQLDKEKYDNYYQLANELEFADKAAPVFEERKSDKKNHHKKEKPANKNIRSLKETQAMVGILSEDEDEREFVNDDELEVGKKRKEDKILKHYRNVEKLNNYMDKIKNVKAQRMQQEKKELLNDGLDVDLDDDIDQDELSSSGEYGLDGVDLDEIEQDNEGMEDLEDEEDDEEEFEDEEEEDDDE